MGKISVVINTLNEEKNLPRALSSIKSFADEVVVVDMESIDNTVKIAKKAGAKVFKHKKTGYVEPARNYAIGKATGEWILILDADEKISKILADKLKRITTDTNSADYYRIPRKNIIFGKWIKHTRYWPDYNIRFFKKNTVTWNELIHSVPMTQGKGLDLEADSENAIVHHHYETVEQYIDRLNRYTTEHAKNKIKDGYKFEWQDLIKRPVSEFLSRFFQGEGYKDGLHGLVLALLLSFSELVLYVKVWQIKKFKAQEIEVEDIIQEMKEAEDEAHYWQADTLIRHGAGIKQKIKRKLKL